jgi:hypothetical protein
LASLPAKDYESSNRQPNQIQHDHNNENGLEPDRRQHGYTLARNWAKVY